MKPGGGAPNPTQSGISPSCTEYAQAESGEGCYSFSQVFQITQGALESWNSVLGSNGENCVTKFQAGVWYCIGVSGTPTAISSSITAPTASAIPSPVQSGIVPGCTKYSEAVAGNDCTSFAAENSITPSQLYSWNPILGPDGENCRSAFWANTYYCVGGPGGSATSPSAAPAPGPTQSGIVPNCNKYALADSGDSCEEFAEKHGIDPTQLYAWNPILGVGGADCGTKLWAGNAYCIGTSGP